jgi:hypothetical protein
MLNVDIEENVWIGNGKWECEEKTTQNVTRP